MSDEESELDGSEEVDCEEEGSDEEESPKKTIKSES